METFQAGDGNAIAYCVDDFTDPWREAKTVILLHSAMANAQRYYAWVPAMARRYRVVRMDLRGHGDSAVPPADPPLSMDRLVQDVLDLMDHLQIERAHFVGNSAGGYVTQNLAMSHPERIESAALFGSTPGLKNTQAASWLPQVAEKGLRGFLAETIAERFDLDTTDPGIVEFFLDQCATNDTAFIGRFIGLMTTLDWSDRLSEIRCPTLIVMPGAETVGSTKNYDVMRDTIPDVEVVTYEGMPHNICDAVPDRCARDVLDFLERRFGDQAGP
ncbi:MAG: alpha/beta hydrolase [Rhodospirillaceae bacterium]|nr:alpha/beta hydrolase [Rhodospirillaceae bacterium]MDD9928827.1 alpha/beta hydrolase [Rhodospirillaceae bacterium]